MKCEAVREMMMDAVTGAGEADPRMREHLSGCPACASKLEELQKTMALLDEWQAPEPSPYFDTRLQSRLREEMARPASGWLSAGWLNWLRRPAWAMSLAAAIFAGALLVGSKSYISQTEAIATKPPSLGLPVQPGTAVGDLQAL